MAGDEVRFPPTSRMLLSAMFIALAFFMRQWYVVDTMHNAMLDSYEAQREMLVESMGRLRRVEDAAARAKASFRAQLEEMWGIMDDVLEPPAPRTASPPLEVPRRPQLSYETFFREHAVRRTPVLLSVDLGRVLERFANAVAGAGDDPVAQARAVMGVLNATCPEAEVEPKRRNADVDDWGRLEVGQKTTIARLADYFSGRAAEYDENPWMLFDWGLKRCGSLVSEFAMPGYFAGDFFHRKPASDVFATVPWPSVFVSKAHGRSDLHIDSHGTHFWMMPFAGVKRFILYLYVGPGADDLAQSDMVRGAGTAASYFMYYDRSQRSFEVDPFSEITPEMEEAMPLLRHVRRVVVEVHPGEVLFVPAGTPHAVENVGDTVALAGNFVDESNFHDALAVTGSQDHGFPPYYLFLNHPRFPRGMDPSPPAYVPYDDLRDWEHSGAREAWRKGEFTLQ